MAGEAYDTWPAGATWVFQGTVAEDSGVGTHNATLIVTPGQGNEIELLYGSGINGGAAANDFAVFIDDGTNILALIQPVITSAAGVVINFPAAEATGTLGVFSPGKFIVSGAMRLVLRERTSTVSVTHTFAVVCRIKGAVPTAVLADSVGTPTLTVNTNKVF